MSFIPNHPTLNITVAEKKGTIHSVKLHSKKFVVLFYVVFTRSGFGLVSKHTRRLLNHKLFGKVVRD